MTNFTRLAIAVRGYYADRLLSLALSLYHKEDPTKMALARFIVDNLMKCIHEAHAK